MHRIVVGSLALLCVIALGRTSPLGADERSGGRSVDAVAKERQDDYTELLKKKTGQAALERIKILQGLAFAPCPTAQRFLLGLLKKAATPGDERAAALDSLLHIADEGGFEDVLAALTQAKDPTLWQVFGSGVGAGRSPGLQAWRKGPYLASPNTDLVAAVLDAPPSAADAGAIERIEAMYRKNDKPPGSVELAARALRALATAKGGALRPTLLEAVRNPDVRVRLVVADVLPGLEPFDAEAEAAVRGLLQDESATVRQAAAAAAGAAKRTSIAEALITLLADPRARTRFVAATALETATGQKLGNDPKAWAAWLAKQDPGKPQDLTLPSYHGVAVKTDRVVFLVDASSSMTWPWRKSPKRIDVARAELAAVLKALTPEILFNVMVYSDGRTWFRKAEVPASPENVSAALQWAEKAMAEPAGDTHLFEALETAFASDPQFDTIFLLTDGNPTSGRYWTAPTLLASVRAWNRHRRAAIHTIGLSLLNEDRGMPNLAEDPQAMTALLSALAGATAGEYREILDAPPPK